MEQGHSDHHLVKEDCMMRKTMTILSKRMLFLDGDHLVKEDCMMRMTKAIKVLIEILGNFVADLCNSPGLFYKNFRSF